jgi:quinol monooxygenase YgiN
MIFIVVKFSIRPEAAEQWLTRVAPFTAATRAEPGNVFFEWSRSVDRPNQFVLIEAFRDRAAGAAHVHSDHFKAAMAGCPTRSRPRRRLSTLKRPEKAGRPWPNCNLAPPSDARRSRGESRRSWRQHVEGLLGIAPLMLCAA